MSQTASQPVPPATFEFLIYSLKMQAEVAMGLMPFGQDPEMKPDLALARHLIDLLAMLQEKTRGNLTMDEQRLVENSVTELRFRFIHALSQTPASPEPVEPAPEASEQSS